MRTLFQFFREEEAATAVEYAVMMALILVVCLVAIRAVGTTTSSTWGANDTALDIAWKAAGGGGS